MRLLNFAITAALLFASSAAYAGVPFWGDKQSQPLDTAPAALKPGQFVWDPEAVPSGPLVVVVSLSEQRAYVYRNGIRIGFTTVSTGKPGHQTPTGVFTILQKDKDHHSTIYNNASMPFTERLTWGGVALHAGGLPGYPSSHGCVHLPSVFAQGLFQISPMGMTVVIADQSSAPADVVHPAVLAPVDAASGAAVEEPRLQPGEAYRWEPQKSPTGPLAIVVSRADQRVMVYRNGIEIGRSRISIENPELGLGTHAYLAVEVKTSGAGDAASNLRWMAVSMPGHAGGDKRLLDPGEVKRVQMPDEFKKEVYSLLHAGVALLVTDAPVLESSTGVPLQVVNADPPTA